MVLERRTMLNGIICYKYVRRRQCACFGNKRLCGFVKNFDNNQTGFIWSSDPRVTQIGNSLTFQGHSGCSFACTLRGVQSILLENENNNNNNNNNNLPYPPIICEKV